MRLAGFVLEQACQCELPSAQLISCNLIIPDLANCLLFLDFDPFLPSYGLKKAPKSAKFSFNPVSDMLERVVHFFSEFLHLLFHVDLVAFSSD